MRRGYPGDLAPGDVVLRFGLHWGSTLYVGSISTSGRSEVTALGDEVIERLGLEDAGALGLEPRHLTYTTLRDLDTATDKLRRDAPAIPVCDV